MDAIEIFWSVIFVTGILFLAYWIRRATKDTPFEHNRPCTPRVQQLKHMEDPGAKGKKENLW